jgi:hypothetical protein
MRHRDYQHYRDYPRFSDREHHPRVSIFIGVLLFLNLHFTGGLLLIAGGIWFLKDHIFLVSPEIFRNFYWPAVIVILGLSFILSSLFKRKT